MEEKDNELEKIKIILGNSWLSLIKEVSEKEKNFRDILDNLRKQKQKYISYLIPPDSEQLEKIKAKEIELDETIFICSDLLEALKPDSWDLICASDLSKRIMNYYERMGKSKN